MTLAGRLETLDLPAILQTLAIGGASGRLTLSQLERHAVVVLRQGRIVYAAGAGNPVTLASVLLRNGLVGERELLAALERQHDGQVAPRRLAEVLVETGLVAPGTLHDLVRRHIQDVVGELLTWKTGFFRFEPAQGAGADSVEVDVGDFVLPGGIAPQELLMRAVAALDRADQTVPPWAGLAPPPRQAPAEGPREPQQPITGSYAADYTGEAVLALLRFASQVLARAVVFAVHGDHVAGVGEFGVEVAGRTGAEAVRDTVLPLRDPSILKLAVERRRAYSGPLEPTRINLLLMARLGGVAVREAVALPLIVRGEPAYVLYGDQGRTGRPLEAMDALESAAARSARIIEKTLARRS